MNCIACGADAVTEWCEYDKPTIWTCAKCYPESRKTQAGIASIIAKVRVSSPAFLGHSFRVKVHEGSDVLYLQASYMRPDRNTGNLERGYGRKWHLSTWATESEIVLTALKAVLTNAEHEIRESFTYEGKRLFGPHISVRELMDVITEDVRPDRAMQADRKPEGEGA